LVTRPSAVSYLYDTSPEDLSDDFKNFNCGVQRGGEREKEKERERKRKRERERERKKKRERESERKRESDRESDGVTESYILIFIELFFVFVQIV